MSCKDTNSFILTPLQPPEGEALKPLNSLKGTFKIAKSKINFTICKINRTFVVETLKLFTMKNYLLSPKCKKIGWILLLPFTALLLFNNGKIEWEISVFSLASESFFSTSPEWFSVIKNNIIDEIACIGVIVSLLLISFSKEREEDEYIAKLRLNALFRALLITYLLLIFELIFIHGFVFLYVLIFNMFSILAIYIILFNVSLYKVRRLVKNEE